MAHIYRIAVCQTDICQSVPVREVRAPPMATSGYESVLKGLVLVAKAENFSAHFRRHRFPAELIAYAVWIYYRFLLRF